MTYDPRGCVSLSWPVLGDLVLLSWAEQEASILGLSAVLLGPKVQSGGWALRRLGRQSGDLGESEPLAAGLGIRVEGLDLGGHRGVLPRCCC